MSLYNHICTTKQNKHCSECNEYITSPSEFSCIEDIPFADFTFKCSDGNVKAHRSILWSRCLYFKTTSWNVNNVSMEVDCTTDVMTKVVDFFYGRVNNFSDPMDVDVVKIINMLNPLPTNVTLLIPLCIYKWNKMLKNIDSILDIGFTREYVIDEMAKYVIYDINTNSYTDNISLNAEILKRIISYRAFSNYCVVSLINIQIKNRTVTKDEVVELCSLVDWVYVAVNKFTMHVANQIINCIPDITLEMIRQAFVTPNYTKGFRGIYDVLKYSDTNLDGSRLYKFTHDNTPYDYKRDFIMVLGKKYPLHEVFKDADEFNAILERDNAMDSTFA